MSPLKLILVVGATGAQGQAVIGALLAPDEKGNPSPYTVRALTRDPLSTQAQALAARGVECFQGLSPFSPSLGERNVDHGNAGSFTDFPAVAKALEGAYGAWINTDGGTVGEMEEIYAGIRIYEVAKRIPSLRHYVWSNLPYVLKKAGFNPEYNAVNTNGKGRVADWLSVQPSVVPVADDALSWSIVTSSPYMDMLKGSLFRPMNIRKDGTVVFAAPIEDGRVPMVALEDLGWWARWTFDHRSETSGRNLGVTSEFVDWNYLVEIFTKVTGKPAVFKRLTLDEWWSLFDEKLVSLPFGNERRDEPSSTVTLRDNYSGFWRILRDGFFDDMYDMGWIRSIHPETYTLEKWLRVSNYDAMDKPVLKNAVDGKRNWGFKADLAALL
ncbi:NmrA domain-containing protein [Mycena venus]|uniref:NmrA domain-containing protein n=1 Tax=Mycena venus TaxID=2733690 RepID=A0A8H6XH65_9AGAR|nr:NmrA domain-containing protein [Mycena venus]